MRHPPSSEKLFDRVPFLVGQEWPLDGRLFWGPTPEPGPASAKLRPTPTDECHLSRIRLVRQQQLMADTIGLISNLDRKLECYLAVQSASPLEESSKLMNDSAVAWIRQTLEDLTATVVGIEAAFTAPRAESLKP